MATTANIKVNRREGFVSFGYGDDEFHLRSEFTRIEQQTVSLLKIVRAVRKVMKDKESLECVERLPRDCWKIAFKMATDKSITKLEAITCLSCREFADLIADTCDEIWKQGERDFEANEKAYFKATHEFYCCLKHIGGDWRKALAQLDEWIERGYYTSHASAPFDSSIRKFVHFDSLFSNFGFVRAFQVKGSQACLYVFIHTDNYKRLHRAFRSLR